MATMYPAMANSPSTVLFYSIDSSTDVIMVADGDKLPDAPNIATIGTGEDAETIFYANKGGNALTDVTRGFQGTAKEWLGGTPIARYFTAYDYDSLRGNVEQLQSQMVSVKDFGAVGDGVTDDTQAFSDAISVADSNGGGIVFIPTPSDSYKIASDITIPASVTLQFAPGAMLSPVTGITITINAGIMAGAYQIFAGAGAIAGKIAVVEVLVEWWGAKGDGVTLCADAFQRTCDYVANNAPNTIVRANNATVGYVLEKEVVLSQNIMLMGSSSMPPSTSHAIENFFGANTLLMTTTLSRFFIYGGAYGGRTIAGFTIFYPNQTDTNPPIVYPATFELSWSASDTFIENIYTVNAYHLINAPESHERLTVRGIRGCVLNCCININGSYDTDRFIDIVLNLLWPKKEISSPSREYVKSNMTGIKIGYADGFQISDFFICGCKHGIEFYAVAEGKPYGQLSNVGIDWCSAACIQVDSFNANGLIFNNLMCCAAPTGLDIYAECDVGTIQINGLSMWDIDKPIIFATTADCDMSIDNADIKWNTNTGNQCVLFMNEAFVALRLNNVIFRSSNDSAGTNCDFSFSMGANGEALIYLTNVKYTYGDLNYWESGVGKRNFIINGFKKLANQSIGTTQTTIAHGLPFVPTHIIVSPLATGMVWQSAVADAANVYLTASASTTADIYLGQ